MRPAHAEVLAVGHELLRGEIVNGNAAWIGQQLALLGWKVTRSAAVGDVVEDIRDEILTALQRVPVVIISGGLGPTQDDLTREGIALAAGVGIERDPVGEAMLRERYASVGREVPARNFQQADLPLGATAIANPVGSAPGVAMRIGGGLVLALPGVPSELHAMVAGGVVDELYRTGIPATPLVSIAIRTAGLWESEVAELLSEVELRARAAGTPEVAFLASGGQTRVVLTGPSQPALAPWVAEVRELLGAAVIEVGDPGVDPSALPRSVVDLLRGRSETVAFAESLTAGLVCATVADVPGASAVLRGGVTTYATDLKASVLGVAQVEQHGAVSRETVEAMAAGVRDLMSATWGVATTGVAGPEASEGHPPGTVHIAVSGPAGTVSRLLALSGPRGRIRLLTVSQALDLLRRELIGSFGG